MGDRKECTIKELCVRYGVTSMTITRWMKNKNLPYFKRGRNVYFVIKDVEKWMEEYNKIKKFNYDEDNKEQNPPVK